MSSLTTEEDILSPDAKNKVEEEKPILVKTCGEIFTIPRRIAMQLGPVHDALANTNDGDTIELISFNDGYVTKKIFAKILEYVEHHIDDQEKHYASEHERMTAESSETIDDWDLKWIGDSIRTMFLLTKVGESLRLEKMTQLCLKRTHQYLHTCTSQQIWDNLKLPDNFLTKEQKEHFDMVTSQFADAKLKQKQATPTPTDFLNTCTPEEIRQILGLPDDLTKEEMDLEIEKEIAMLAEMTMSKPSEKE